MRDITMSKKIKVAVCKGRHEIPQATDGAIFGNTIKEREIYPTAYAVRQTKTETKKARRIK